MLDAAMTDQVIDRSTTLAEACRLLWQHPQVLAELRELLAVLADRVEHLHHRHDTHPDVPLQVHARYTRIELLAAFGIGAAAKVSPWQTGVYWASHESETPMAVTWRLHYPLPGDLFTAFAAAVA
ncbi:hypothetical protein K7C98_42525 [Nannocystis pusilla]|uniref:Uncharacterized protein n=1 Tax=Nannocystis pusilla TaxID=889268 RepID=A0ABS7U5U7_9BACT|nr:hypothetical protein [Nannocystis pusilla]MBZ5715948.1 hypothetical protein [Nannocystis pusilla]